MSNTPEIHDTSITTNNLVEESQKLHENFNGLESSDDERTLVKAVKKRVQKFSDSESDLDNDKNKESLPHKSNSNNSGGSDNSDSDDYTIILKRNSVKSRLKKTVDDDSNSSSECTQNNTVGINHDCDYADAVLDNNLIPAIKNVEQQNRMKNKRNRLKERFKSLLHARDKDIENDKGSMELSNEKSVTEYDSSNDEEKNSIETIKQKIKERSSNLKMTIYDPDTSDEESHTKIDCRLKKQSKATIPSSPKPQRMTAKQAMENMKKIKSESNRMLREKEVSLPYHRPKALSLKDIMSRRKPALSTDGKALPIKMNEEQLRQYALSLEQRQKEMMELCKSDTDEDDVNELSRDVDIGNTAINRQVDVPEPTVNNSDGIPMKPEIVAENINTENNDEDCEEGSILDHNQLHSNMTTPKPNTEPSTLENVQIISDTGIHDKECENVTESNKIDDFSTNTNEILDKCNESNRNIEEKSDQNESAEMQLVYNDSIEDTDYDNKSENINDTNSELENKSVEKNNVIAANSYTDSEEMGHLCNNIPTEKVNNTEQGNQIISLGYDGTEKNPICLEGENMKNSVDKMENEINNEFPENDEDIDDINMEEIDSMIENAEILRDNVDNLNSPALVKDASLRVLKPKLTGGPGMIIDLDGSNPVAPKKLTGVDLLKERFTFFAKLKTPEEMERGKEKRQKPGTLYLKLKHDLEEKIAEQRSLEWAKRLESEKLHTSETYEPDESAAEDDIDKIEAKLKDDVIDEKESSTESEEDVVEDDVLIEDKPRKRNPLLDEEAEESEDESAENDNTNLTHGGENDGDHEANSEDDESSEEEESSESENECNLKPKKGRILKAFEDSDDEDEGTPKLINSIPDKLLVEKESEQATVAFSLIKENEKDVEACIAEKDIVEGEDAMECDKSNVVETDTQKEITESQDDVLQLAQVPTAHSDDLFTSQESNINQPSEKVVTPMAENCTQDLGSQTFSILNSNSVFKNNIDFETDGTQKLSVISETQPFDDNLDAVVGMCSGSFSQNYIEFKPPSSQSQTLGEDLLDMCTGKFYDNQFVSQTKDNANTSIGSSQEFILNDTTKESTENEDARDVEKNVLMSVLDELNEPQLEAAKPLKYFYDGKSQNKENECTISNTQLKKKFIIDSDDETNDTTEPKKKKKLKKKKPEMRALQISDDEEDEYSEPDEELLSENDDNDNEEKFVEYDSEENEVEVKPQNPKKKRKTTEFFEQEAELTSEDEWVGSGDEDEAGLDRMEREAGDDDTFNQGQLQRELGQIHMRDVLDQDKREVRLIQELLFEDDMGGGGRQRKFRWRNADGDEETGTIPELGDTQEEEFESEEQWRKQRHEREMFLRQMKNADGPEDELNVTINRTTIIKANLLSRTMSSLIDEANDKTNDAAKSPPAAEKKTVKDIPSPKKPFSILQQNYHGSLLTRGRGALARLAALATPLAVDDDAPKIGHLAPSSKRNFVFAAIAPEDKEEPKVKKRKSDTIIGTPQLVKKMKTEEKKRLHKNSLLDHMKT